LLFSKKALIMKPRSMTLRLAAIAAAITLIGCDNTVAVAPPYVSVSISPRPLSIPAGGTQVFTGTVSNNLSLPQWSISAAASVSTGSSIGTLTSVAGSSDEILYTAPATPPIYDFSAGVPQGRVTLNATTTPPVGSQVAADVVSFVIATPSVTVGLTPTKATVYLGATEQFLGYAVGNIDGTLVWEANGYIGGSVPVPLSNPVTYTYPYGTINFAGTYVAPTTMPASGNTVTITLISDADPTKTQSAVVTLQ
jgi:hypothetical protein